MNLPPVRVPRMAALASPSPAVMLPGELAPFDAGVPAREAGLLTLDPSAMMGVAVRAIEAGAAGMTAVGVAGLQHGDGATTVARAVAVCLADAFNKRVVLVEANQRSACLRRIYGLPEGPGLADVTARRVSLGGALQMAGEHRQVVVLPASLRESGTISAEQLRELLRALLNHVDAAVVDMAPVLPYRDTGAMCGALDGVTLVMRGGHSTVADGQSAVARVQEAGVPVLGTVLNRERQVVPKFFERWLGGRA